MIRLIFIGTILVEIVLFVQIGGLVGAGATVALVVLSALAGSLLLRRGGAGAIARARQALESGRDPGDDMVDGALLLMAAILLIVPGFATSALGLLLLVPGLRAIIGRRIRQHWTAVTPAAPLRTGREQVIEGEFVDVTRCADDGPRRPSGWTGH
ncbi:MAG: FxsA family protein [Rubellimicrobium sp.]|nr:FxsA family protein [Rubellimicrobium sp.]